MKLQENFEPEELVALARLDMEKYDFSAALSKLKQAVVMENASLEAFAMLAKVYAQLGLYDRAIEQFEFYLQRDPDALIEKFQLGMAQFDAKKTTEALATWGQLLAGHPNFPPALYYRGLALLQQELPEQAKASLTQLVESAEPDNIYCERAKQILRDIDDNKVSANDAAAHSRETAIVEH